MSKKSPVKIEEVREAMARLESAGTKITDRAIQTELGDRGSFTTIVAMRKKLQAGSESSSQELTLPKEMHDPVYAAIKRVLADAHGQLHQEAQRQVLEARAVADQAIEEAYRTCDETLDRLEEREERIVGLEAEVSGLRVELSTAREGLAAASSRLQALEKSLEQELERSEKLMVRLLSLTERLASDSETKQNASRSRRQE